MTHLQAVMLKGRAQRLCGHHAELLRLTPDPDAPSRYGDYALDIPALGLRSGDFDTINAALTKAAQS